MTKEEEVIEEIVKGDEGDEHHHTDPKDRLFMLLFRVTPSQWQTTANWGIH